MRQQNKGRSTTRQALGLKQPAQPQRRKQPPQDLQDANEHDQDFEQVGEPPVANELLDEIEAERPDDNDDQHVDQEQQHRDFPLMASGQGRLWQENSKPSRLGKTKTEFFTPDIFTP